MIAKLELARSNTMPYGREDHCWHQAGSKILQWISLGATITAASMAMGNPALAFARSVGGRTLMEGAKTGFASGGEVDGPGTGISDSIVARL